ncbi:MAG TPA: hypothetical protein VE988_18845 [Gemmataceae bacterium]|nr:hypothetical protein [Gemmataceae bacterium]
MATDIGIRFPSEAEALRKQCEAEKGLTADERFRAVLDMNATAEALARAGGTYEAQLKHQHQVELEWQQIMKEFLKAHDPARCRQ